MARFAADADRHRIVADRLLVAVSGGADSLAMLLLARAALGDAVAAATVDHGLNPDGARWAADVAALCARLGIAHDVLTLDVEIDGEGLQAAARRARYDALAAAAVRRGRDTVITAHHANDQAETLLMRLLRGSGLAGLSAIRAERALDVGVRLVRPLLGWRRADLQSVVASAGLEAIVDPANADPRFDRTRARALIGTSDPRPFARAADHLGQAEAALAWAATEAAITALARDGSGWWLDPVGLPAEIVRRLVLSIFSEAGHHPDGPGLDRLLQRLRADQSGTLGPLLARPGARWRFEKAPARRVRSTDDPDPVASAIVH
ncbi:tRNA(Ile)-lysidine synthase [Sphingomonas jejuensis]|uniref:tRNA(Ile)-lysidine synthase n=1 Tax=Sphingomonas jejuensis TaxID=904715 RepID=A0ABX0XQP5_9SPHN|nr:tRNA(Ile)-lysidine synthase [Sphingomonas jejuensis]